MNNKYSNIKNFICIVVMFSGLCNSLLLHASTVCVSNTQELYNALSNIKGEDATKHIILQPGVYYAPRTLQILADGITIESLSGNPHDTVIQGIGMKETPSVNNIIRVAASNFTLKGVTLKDAPNHLVQVAGETNASYPVFERVIFQNSYEQMLKVSYDKTNRPDKRSVGGIVRNSIFQYTAEAAPYYYTGGIDAIGAADWLVTDSLFKNIASPAKRIAQHAVHFWTNARDNRVINNVFINNDRAIGFGMVLGRTAADKKVVSHEGGEISGNIIYHTDNGAPFADVSIILEASSGAVVKNNWIYMEHDYPNAIEYRFTATSGAIIHNNRSNKRISQRDDASASLITNKVDFLKPDANKKLKRRVVQLRNEISAKTSVINEAGLEH